MIRPIAIGTIIFMLSSGQAGIQSPFITVQTYRPEPYEAKTEFDEQWGIRLSAKNIGPEGLTLCFSQAGGNDVNELLFGTEFYLDVFKDGQWERVPYISDSIGWDSVAYSITPDAFTEYEISWKYIYGALPSGRYRISKSIHNYRSPGDYDEKLYSLEFEIK